MILTGSMGMLGRRNGLSLSFEKWGVWAGGGDGGIWQWKEMA